MPSSLDLLSPFVIGCSDFSLAVAAILTVVTKLRNTCFMWASSYNVPQYSYIQEVVECREAYIPLGKWKTKTTLFSANDRMACREQVISGAKNPCKRSREIRFERVAGICSLRTTKILGYKHRDQ